MNEGWATSEFVTSAIAETFRAHGIASDVSSSSVRVGKAVRINAYKNVRRRGPETVQIQLDVQTEAEDLGSSSPIVDSFAGLGPTELDAEKNAFGKFLLGSFHVVAESLTSHDCDSEQVEWETWGSQHVWDVCSGPLIAQSTVECRTKTQYGVVLHEIQNQFVRQAQPGPHWMRFFLGFVEGKLQGLDVILDGVVWPEAQEIIEGASWTPSMHYESLRHLLIALPAGSAMKPAPANGLLRTLLNKVRRPFD